MVYTDPDEVPWSAYLAVAAVMALIVAALLPWVARDVQSVNGLEYSNGYITAGVALASVGLLIAYEWEVVAQLGAALAGTVSIWFAYDTWTEVGVEAGQSPEVGVYLTLLAGAVLVAAAVYGAAETYLLGDAGDDDAATRTVE